MIEIEKFISGHYEQAYEYRYFVPNCVNDDWVWSDAGINHLLEKAAVKLGELNSFSRLVPNIDLFIQLHVAKEAVVSSKIEGTQTKMDEALLPISEIEPEKRNDWTEVNNYIRAINHAVSELETLPISSRLIKSTHRILLDGVRGTHKLPGEYRTSQNWIAGVSLSDAKFIPPHQDLVNRLMGDLENFLNNDAISLPALIKVAIAHYQFETIHPFLDGNGRIGRLLITLFLVKEKLLEKPLLYLSTHFEKRKDLYYDNLSNIRSKNDLAHWIKYFLVGVEQTATLAAESLAEILRLKENSEILIRERYGRRSTSAILLLHAMLKNPYSTVEQAASVCGITYKSANDLVKKMCEDGLISEATKQSRNRLFVFQKYLDIFNKEDVL